MFIGNTLSRVERKFFDIAIAEARLGLEAGGIPIGAVLVHNDQINGRGHNQRVQAGSVIRHAVMDALEQAGRQAAQTYRESTLYTTLSPCSMCAGAIRLYGIRRVIVGENETFTGDEAMLLADGVEVVVLQDRRCINLMRSFIEDRPELWSEDIGQPVGGMYS